MNFYGFLTWVTARRQERGVLNKINDAPINGWGRQSWTRENSWKHSAEHCLGCLMEQRLMEWSWAHVLKCDDLLVWGLTQCRDSWHPSNFWSLHEVHFISILPENNNMFYECCSQYVKYLDKESERCALFSKFITFSVLFISWMFMISPAFIISARLLGGIAAPQPSCGKLNFPYF